MEGKKISKSIATERTNEKWKNVDGEVIIYLAERRKLQINYLHRKVSERSRLVCQAGPLKLRGRGFSIAGTEVMRCTAANGGPAEYLGQSSHLLHTLSPHVFRIILARPASIPPASLENRMQVQFIEQGRRMRV